MATPSTPDREGTGMSSSERRSDSPDEGRDRTEGLPDDLTRVLRDQSIIVPQDAAVFELIAKWRNAPSNTASAD